MPLTLYFHFSLPSLISCKLFPAICALATCNLNLFGAFSHQTIYFAN